MLLATNINGRKIPQLGTKNGELDRFTRQGNWNAPRYSSGKGTPEFRTQIWIKTSAITRFGLTNSETLYAQRAGEQPAGFYLCARKSESHHARLHFLEVRRS